MAIIRRGLEGGYAHTCVLLKTPQNDSFVLELNREPQGVNNVARLEINSAQDSFNRGIHSTVVVEDLLIGEKMGHDIPKIMYRAGKLLHKTFRYNYATLNCDVVVNAILYDVYEWTSVVGFLSNVTYYASSIVQDSDPYGLTLTEVEKLKEEKKNKDNK